MIYIFYSQLEIGSHHPAGHSACLSKPIPYSAQIWHHWFPCYSPRVHVWTLGSTSGQLPLSTSSFTSLGGAQLQRLLNGLCFMPLCVPLSYWTGLIRVASGILWDLDDEVLRCLGFLSPRHFHTYWEKPVVMWVYWWWDDYGMEPRLTVDSHTSGAF